MIRLRLSNVVVLALAVSLAFGVYATSATALTTVSINGRAVDAQTGKPTGGFQCGAYRWNPATQMWALVDNSYVWADGLIVLGVELSSAPTVFVFRGGEKYLDQVYGGGTIEISEGGLPMGFADSEAFQEATKVDCSTEVFLSTVRMVPRPIEYGAVSGHATEQFGHAVSPMVRVWRENPETGVWSAGAWQQATDGNFNFVGTKTAPLTGRIKIEHDEGGMLGGSGSTGFWGGADFASARVLNLGPTEKISGVNPVFELGTRITGRAMRTESKSAAGGVSVEYDADGIGGHRTGSDGQYFIGENCSGVPNDYLIYAVDTAAPYWPGRYYYYGQTATRASARVVTLAEGQMLTDKDIWLSRSEAVAGKVLNQNGAPVPDITARVYRILGDGSAQYVGSDFTDSLGMYRVLCSSTGTYSVRFVDSAGTAATNDDRSVWLGDTDTVATATRLRVNKDQAAVADPFVLSMTDGRASRVFGLNNCDAAIAVSRDAFAAGETTCVVLASESSFADALSGANIAGAVQGPVLLTKRDAIPRGLIEETERLGVRKVYLMGGEAVISKPQERLWAALGYEVERIGGSDRYVVNASSAIEAESLGAVAPGSTAFVTSGEVYPDAVAVSPAVYANKSVVFLVKKSGAPVQVLRAAGKLGVKRLAGVGGASSLSAASIRGFQSRGIRVNRVAAGSDRYDTAARFARWAKNERLLDAGHAGIATGLSFQDALIAGPALGELRAPLLLTKPTSLPTSTASALTAFRGSNGPATVSAYGGTGRISSSVLAQARAR